MLITMKTSGGTIAINPDEVVSVSPIATAGYTRVVVKGDVAYEIAVIGEFAEVVARINQGCLAAKHGEVLEDQA